MNHKASYTSPILALVACVLALTSLYMAIGQLPPEAEAPSPQDEILHAIWQLESDCAFEAPDGAWGEVGPLQITQAYWEDARPVVGYGTYADCRSLDYSLRVVRAYMQRWVPEAWISADAEVILRTHNGGPRGAQKSATEQYWEKGKKLLQR